MKGIYQTAPSALATLREVTGAVLNHIGNLVPNVAELERLDRVKDEAYRRAILHGGNMF